MPDNPLPRAVAPNARGEFPELVAGLPYREWVFGNPMPLEAYSFPCSSALHHKNHDKGDGDSSGDSSVETN